MPCQPRGNGRIDVARDIIDKHHFARLDIRQVSAHLAEAGVINRCVGLDQLQLAGNHNVAKTLQERVVGPAHKGNVSADQLVSPNSGMLA